MPMPWVLRSQRQQVIASNIANADTPGFVARDFDFAKALEIGVGAPAGPGAVSTTSNGHMRLGAMDARHPDMAYSVQTQPSQDGNSVDLDRERANFVDDSIRYESTLRFINGHVKTMLSAITGAVGMTTPRIAFGATPKGGNTCSPAKPVLHGVFYR